MCVYLCVGVPAVMPTEAGGVGFPAAGTTRFCEPPDVGAGSQT